MLFMFGTGPCEAIFGQEERARLHGAGIVFFCRAILRECPSWFQGDFSQQKGRKRPWGLCQFPPNGFPWMELSAYLDGNFGVFCLNFANLALTTTVKLQSAHYITSQHITAAAGSAHHITSHHCTSQQLPNQHITLYHTLHHISINGYFILTYNISLILMF